MRRPNRKPNYMEMGDIPNWAESAEYIIHKEGNDYIAANGQTGVEDKRSTNFSTATQYAIDNTTAGTITINCDVAAFDTELTAEDDVVLDFTNHLLTINGNPDFYSVTEKNNAGLKNTKITVPAAYTGKIISLLGTTAGSRVNVCLFDNIFVVPDVPGSATYAWTGIYIGQDTSNNCGMLNNRFSNMWFYRPEYGIHYYSADEEPWANLNHFDNIFIYEYTKGVYIESGATIAGNGFNGNKLINVGTEPKSGQSTHGFHILGNLNNRFWGCYNDNWAGLVGDANGVNMGANSYYNHWDSVALPTEITDGGNANRWFNTHWGTFAMNATTHLNYWGKQDVRLFEGLPTSTAPHFYIYGKDNANNRRYFRIQTTNGGALTHTRLQTDGGDIWLDPSTDIVRFGVRTATGDAVSNGYITAKDSAGNAIKLMTTA